MILAELRHRMPDAAWFAADTAHPLPVRSPVSAADLATLYPAAAAACRANEARMREAREVTAALQAGDPGLSSLWRSIVAEAKTAILATCDRLGAQFDLTLGESDAQPEIPELLAHMEATGKARREDGALMVDVVCPADAHPVPPLVLEKADGSALYATTDLATLLMRRRDLEAERILYVVDGRQHLHFLQLFRAAEIAGIAAADKLEHIDFGTVNGADGKPFKTRAGDVMSLVELLDLAKAKAKERLQAGGRLQDAAPETVEDAADAVGMAALRVADLLAHRSTGYRLDLDRAIAFEGKTGPYLLYALVRLRALLTKAGDDRGPIRLGCPAERRLALACLGLDGALQRAVAIRSPHELTNWAFDLAAEVSRFYGDCPVISEADPTRRHSRIALCMAAERALSYALHLLGCRVPVAM